MSDETKGSMLISCANYLVCREKVPKQYLKGDVCLNCDVTFGNPALEIRKAKHDGSDGKCPVCFEDVEAVGKQVVVGPSCSHIKCVDCFRAIWFSSGESSDDPRPPFPYPEKWQQYLDSGEDDTEYYMDPLFIEWVDLDADWDDRRRDRMCDPPCPVCGTVHVPDWNK